VCITLHNRHYAKYEGARIRHPNRAKRQPFPVTAARFREARLTVGLGVEACSHALGVSDRTIRNWESGTTRIPFAAYKLLRVLKGGRYLAHPIWRDYRVWGDTLFTPEGHRFQAGQLAWWSLLVRQARAFGQLMQERRAGEAHVSVSERAFASASMASHAGAMGVASSNDAGGEATRLDVQAIAAVDEVSRLPPSNRGVSRFRKGDFDRQALSAQLVPGGAV
jgi:DNA-binding transcriptional regulator YiaG